MKFNRISRKAVCALIVASSLAACSSDSKPEASTPAPADTTPAAAATTEVPATTDNGSADAAAAAAAAVEKALIRPTQIEVTAPLGVAAPKGKTIDWIQCSIPACTQLGVQSSQPEWLFLGRGLHRERADADGHPIGDATDETPSRGIWRHYKSLMEAA